VILSATSANARQDIVRELQLVHRCAPTGEAARTRRMPSEPARGRFGA
jgi:hypothetical protein